MHPTCSDFETKPKVLTRIKNQKFKYKVDSGAYGVFFMFFSVSMGAKSIKNHTPCVAEFTWTFLESNANERPYGYYS